MKIRKGTKKDYKELAKLWLEFEKYQDSLWNKEKKKLSSVFEETKKNVLELLEKETLKLLNSKESAYFLAEKDNKIIGYLSISIKNNFEIHQLEKFGRLHYAFVKEEYRNQGIFTKLLKEVKKWFKEKKIKYWTLSVSSANNKVHKYYKKLGFIDKEIEMIGKIN